MLYAVTAMPAAAQTTGMQPLGGQTSAQQPPPAQPAAAQAAGESGAAVESPMDVVNDLHNMLLKAMQGGKNLGYAGRYSLLEPVIASHFDTPLIVKVILSRYWDQMTALQKKSFIAVFQKLTVSTYASRFDDYNGEKFVELSTEQLTKGRVLIKTELQRPNDKPVKLDYLMQQDNGRWLIISVIADGVNDLSLKRAEYAAVIKDKGYDGLLNDIEQKIKGMESDKGS